jgi:hypothetical protein
MSMVHAFGPWGYESGKRLRFRLERLLMSSMGPWKSSTVPSGKRQTASWREGGDWDMGSYADICLLRLLGFKYGSLGRALDMDHIVSDISEARLVSFWGNASSTDGILETCFGYRGWLRSNLNNCPATNCCYHPIAIVSIWVSPSRLHGKQRLVEKEWRMSKRMGPTVAAKQWVHRQIGNPSENRHSTNLRKVVSISIRRPKGPWYMQGTSISLGLTYTIADKYTI